MPTNLRARGAARIGSTPHLASIHSLSWDRHSDHRARVPDRQPRTPPRPHARQTGTCDRPDGGEKIGPITPAAQTLPARGPTPTARRSGTPLQPTTTPAPPRTPATRSRLQRPPCRSPTHTHQRNSATRQSTRPPIPVQRGILNQPSSYHEPEHPPGENETPASMKARAYRRPHCDRLWLLLGVGVQPKQQSAPPSAHAATNQPSRC